MADKTLLIGDIGGTNVRFAIANPERPGFSDAMTLQCADYASADDAIRHYLNEIAAASPDVICLAVAGPVIDGVVQVTNNHWTLSAADIAADLGTCDVQLLNDFEAVAFSIPQLQSGGTKVIGLPERKPTLAELIEEGTHVVAGGEAVDRQTRLYPLGTARALAHVLRHTTVVRTHLT